MLKIFLVEDDAAIRESINRNVKWEQHGYEFVGQAADGEMAYSKIKVLRPDVIITDLRMPFMDGLELSRLVRKEMPEIKIIILTGLNDFESVQEALHIGVTEYLLKPVTAEALTETLVSVRGLIEEEQENRAYQHLYHRDMAELRDLKLQQFFENWVAGNKKVYELLDIAHQFGISLNASNYVVIRFQLFMEGDLETYSEELEKLYENAGNELEADESILLFKQGLQGWALIVKGTGEQPADKVARKISAQLESILAGHDKVRYIIAIGTQTDRLQDIAKSYNSASHAYAYHYILGKSAVVRADELQETMAQHGGKELDIHAIDVTKIDGIAVERFLRSGSANAAQALIDDLFDGVGERNMQSFLLRQYIVMNINFAVASFLEKIGIDKAAIASRFEKINLQASELSTISGTQNYLVKLIKYALELRDNAAQNQYGTSIEKSREYIRAHFADDYISLNTTAKSVNLSPAHFSSIFSQETGKTFTEFLTEVRLEKAKELLLCSAKRSSEIAYEVGYRDPHYFSYVFKKLEGCSPREFRASGKEQQ